MYRIRTSYKIVPLTKMNKYLHSDTSETEVNVNISANNDSEKFLEHCYCFHLLYQRLDITNLSVAD
jgi:hypothetical protein